MLGVDVNLSGVWRWHPVLGWTQRPGTGYEYRVDGELVRVQFNSRGFRDVEHETAKPPGVKRIVLVGDSFCEALQVNLEDTFFHVLQRRLNEASRDGSRWEVVNLGVGDFGTAQELLALRQYGLAYSPDLVLCQVFPLNDIGNNSLALATLYRSANDGYRPYFVLEDGGLRPASAQSLGGALRCWLASFRLLERTLLAVRERLARFDPAADEAARRRRLERLGFPPLEPLLYTFVPEPEQIAPVRDGWRVTERCLEEMARLCASRGIPFGAVVIPYDAMVGPRWAEFAAQQPPPAMDPAYPERRLAALFDRLGVPHVAMRPVFEARLDEYLPCRDGHLGPSGHRLTAATLHECLATAGLVPPP